MVATFTTLTRANGFQKGRAKTGGRKKGTPNIHTQNVRFAITEAARRIGGIDRLVEWIQEREANEFAFWVSIWPRLLPWLVRGAGPNGEIELNMKIDPSELMRKLQERNLPPDVFGIDEPPAIGAPKQIEHVPVTENAPGQAVTENADRIIVTGGNGLDHDGAEG
jgi:hypothetical protein